MLSAGIFSLLLAILSAPNTRWIFLRASQVAAMAACLLPLTAFGQVDETKVDEWFHGCRVTAGDIGEHNAGVAADVIANWPAADTERQVQAHVSLDHGLGRSVSATSQTTALLTALIARASAQGVSLDSNVRIVTEGESTTAGTSSWAYDAWPERLMRRDNWVGKGILINQAQGSQNISELSAQYTAQVFPYRATGSVTSAWLIVMIGIKDIDAGRTAAQVMADIEAYLTTAEGHGFETVLMTSMYNNDFTAGEKAEMLALNALILASTVPDHVIDAAAAIGQPDASPSNYDDTVHPNGTGYDAIADTVNDTITP
jgi:lysophospholipase L1-like esterase